MSRRSYTCSRCGARGHNTRTCPQPAEEAPTPPPKRRRGRPPETIETFVERTEARYPGLLKRLGSIPDKKLAGQYRITRQRVHQIRTRMGVIGLNQRHRALKGHCVKQGGTTRYLLLPTYVDDDWTQWITLPLRSSIDEEVARHQLRWHGYTHAPIYQGHLADPMGGLVVGMLYVSTSSTHVTSE